MVKYAEDSNFLIFVQVQVACLSLYSNLYFYMHFVNQIEEEFYLFVYWCRFFNEVNFLQFINNLLQMFCDAL